MTQIKLEIIDDKIKVTTPYNEAFVTRARNLRGTWKDDAWWFDDSIIDYVRDAMTECYGTTGEEPFEYCSLLITDYTGQTYHGPHTVFGRTIARAFGRDSGAKLGDDIVFISGEYDSGGSVKNWMTRIDNATFEIQNFPLPATELPNVQEAIREGWCKIKKSTKTTIKEFKGTSPEVYSIIGPYAMNRKVIREVGNEITTTEDMTWFVKYEGSELKAFISIEETKPSWAIKNFYQTDGEKELFYEFAEMIISKFQETDKSKLYCYVTTDMLEKSMKLGFKMQTEGKNWHKLIITK